MGVDGIPCGLGFDGNQLLYSGITFGNLDNEVFDINL
jgi:hypothetical protein